VTRHARRPRSVVSVNAAESAMNTNIPAPTAPPRYASARLGDATLCERGKRSKDRVELQTATGRPDAAAAALTLTRRSATNAGSAMLTADGRR